MIEQQIIERVRGELSETRFKHTQGVVEAAVQLAERFGANVESARRAAWIHDIAREWPYERLQKFAEQIEIPSGFASIPELLHGPIGAALAADWFDIHDVDIANAIRFHTTGRLDMSKLEMILCLADAIEAGRNYPGVDDIRHLAERDLVEALAVSLDSVISYLLAQHQPIFPLTVMARNELWEQVSRAQSTPHEAIDYQTHSREEIE